MRARVEPGENGKDVVELSPTHEVDGAASAQEWYRSIEPGQSRLPCFEHFAKEV
jgi:hypothetical protein